MDDATQPLAARIVVKLAVPMLPHGETWNREWRSDQADCGEFGERRAHQEWYGRHPFGLSDDVRNAHEVRRVQHHSPPNATLDQIALHHFLTASHRMHHSVTELLELLQRQARTPDRMVRPQ